MKKLWKMLLCFVFLVGGITSAYAQFVKPEDAIEYRKAVMTLIGHHFGRMAAVVKGQRLYDRNDFARDAALVDTFAKLPWEAFRVQGTGKDVTRLKAEAFREPSKFSEAGRKMEAEVAKLATVANSGNLDVIKRQFGEVAKSCQGCHKQFRAD